MACQLLCVNWRCSFHSWTFVLVLVPPVPGCYLVPYHTESGTGTGALCHNLFFGTFMGFEPGAGVMLARSRKLFLKMMFTKQKLGVSLSKKTKKGP